VFDRGDDHTCAPCRDKFHDTESLLLCHVLCGYCNDLYGKLRKLPATCLRCKTCQVKHAKRCSHCVAKKQDCYFDKSGEPCVQCRRLIEDPGKEDKPDWCISLCEEHIRAKPEDHDDTCMDCEPYRIVQPDERVSEGRKRLSELDQNEDRPGSAKKRKIADSDYIPPEFYEVCRRSQQE
jgi:hypothetical protein